MIRQLVAELLKSIGCTVNIEGNVLTARRGSGTLTLGFPNENNASDVLKEVAGAGSQGVIVPLYDDFPQDEADSLGIPVLDRESLEEDVVQVLLGKKETKDTIIGSLAADCMGDQEVAQEAMVKPILDRRDVVEIGSKTVDGFNYILDLVPYFVYDYVAIVEEDGEVHESRGTIGVNALTGSPELWSEDLESVDGLEYFDRKREPKKDEKEAFRIAERKAVELGTVVKERVRERDGTTIEERKSHKPKKEDIQMEAKGLVYLPIWCVEGSKGSVIIDASTGKVLKEDLYT